MSDEVETPEGPAKKKLEPFAVSAFVIGVSIWPVYLFCGVGILADVEVIAILLLARRAPVDIISVFTLRPQMEKRSEGQVNA